MTSPCVCNSHTCKRSARALCICCQQYLCIDHLKDHADFLNAQLSPLADEINTLFNQFNNISLLQPTLLVDLDQWRDETHRVVDRYYEEKKRYFEELVRRDLSEQKTKLDRLRNQVNELIQEQEATQEHINSINDSLRSIQQQIDRFEYPQYTLSPLVIGDHIISIHDKTSKSKDLLPLPLPYRTTTITNACSSISANNNYMLINQNGKLCLIDQQLITQREIPWVRGYISSMLWSKTLAQFIIISYQGVFILEEKTMTIGQISLGSDISDNKGWYCGTCFKDNLFLLKTGWGPTICVYKLRPSIEFIKEYRSPVSCTKDENINDLDSNTNALGLIVSNRQNEVHLDLCSPTTFERLWSIQLGSLRTTYRLRCCSLINDQWIVINSNNCELLHISSDGDLVGRQTYNPLPVHAVQSDPNTVVIMTESSVNLHQLS